MVIAYTSRQLRQVCQLSMKSLMRVSWEVYYNLKQLDICYATPTHRGISGCQCRLRAPKPIQPIVTTTRNSVVKQTGVNNANLITLTSTGSHCAKLLWSMSYQCCDVCAPQHSICNKQATVKEHTIDQKADLMFLTETWCKPNKTCSQRVSPARLQLHWRVPFFEAWRRCRIVIQVGIYNSARLHPNNMTHLNI